MVTGTFHVLQLRSRAIRVSSTTELSQLYSHLLFKEYLVIPPSIPISDADLGWQKVREALLPSSKVTDSCWVARLKELLFLRG